MVKHVYKFSTLEVGIGTLLQVWGPAPLKVLDYFNFLHIQEKNIKVPKCQNNIHFLKARNKTNRIFLTFQKQYRSPPQLLFLPLFKYLLLWLLLTQSSVSLFNGIINEILLCDWFVFSTLDLWDVGTSCCNLFILIAVQKLLCITKITLLFYPFFCWH